MHLIPVIKTYTISFKTETHYYDLSATRIWGIYYKIIIIIIFTVLQEANAFE